MVLCGREIVFVSTSEMWIIFVLIVLCTYFSQTQMLFDCNFIFWYNLKLLNVNWLNQCELVDGSGGSVVETFTDKTDF